MGYGENGGPKAELVLSEDERDQLVRWSRRAKSAQSLVLRSRDTSGCGDYCTRFLGPYRAVDLDVGPHDPSSHANPIPGFAHAERQHRDDDQDMMSDAMMERFSRSFEVELAPPGRRDAAQAVLYRVGDPLDLLDLLQRSPQRCRRR